MDSSKLFLLHQGTFHHSQIIKDNRDFIAQLLPQLRKDPLLMISNKTE